jgi:hypothetical protein
MKNIDIEIYISQFKSFFEKNPNDLMELLGNDLSEEFFNKVEEQCYTNLKNGVDISVTREQLIKIVVQLKEGVDNPEEIKNIRKLFQKTTLGSICLN